MAVSLFAFRFIREPSRPLGYWQPSRHPTPHCFALAWPRRPSSSGSACPNVISPLYMQAVMYMHHSLLLGSKYGVYLSSPTSYHHCSCCEPYRFSRTAHFRQRMMLCLEQSHQPASSFWGVGVEGAERICVPEGNRKKSG